jgi:Tfp pilus assembly protein PilE
MPLPRADAALALTQILLLQACGHLCHNRYSMISRRQPPENAYTLIELVVTVMVIAMLLGLVISAGQNVFDRSRKAQAKNDLLQIVTAVNSYYTEYGKYPLTAAQNTDALATFTTNNSDVINTLRAVAAGANAADALNPRKIIFLSPPQVGDTNSKGGVAATSGIYYDAWGQKAGNAEAGVYHIRIDGDYNNDVANPYSSNAGPAAIRQGVIAWSLGKDGRGGSGDKAATDAKDDVISWQ